MLDTCRAREAEGRDGGILHRRAGGGALTEIAGSSDVVDRGFVTYSNEAKQQMLGVPPQTLETTRRGQPRDRRGDGARRARQRRRRSCRRRSPASPDPAAAAPDKPVGLVHFAAASRSGALMHAEKRYGDIGRIDVRRKSVLQALMMLKNLADKT